MRIKELIWNMKIIIVSKYPIIREGIIAILSKNKNMNIQFACRSIEEALAFMKGNLVDFILLDIHKENKMELDLINDIKASEINTKWMILDFYEDEWLFIKALKYGVNGYILGRSTEEEILYAMNQVIQGKKYFDSYFIDFVIKDSDYENKLGLLTIREKQILAEISNGLSNQKIANKFCITQNTVKKHISHIFEKLSLNDRTEVALYVNKFENEIR